MRPKAQRRARTNQPIPKTEYARASARGGGAGKTDSEGIHGLTGHGRDGGGLKIGVASVAIFGLRVQPMPSTFDC